MKTTDCNNLDRETSGSESTALILGGLIMKYYHIYFNTCEVLVVGENCSLKTVVEQLDIIVESGAKITRMECRDENNNIVDI